MKQQSSIDSAKERVPSFSARYELFVKRLENESARSRCVGYLEALIVVSN